MKNFLRAENIQKIFESKEFIWIWAAVIIICWITGGWLYGFVIAALVACVILCTCRDTLPVITILWTFVFMLGVNRHSLEGFLPAIVAVIPIFLGFIVNIIRFKPSFGIFNYKAVKVTTVAVIVFFVAVALSGIAMKNRNLAVAFIVVAICVLFAVGYVFLSATISGGEDGKRVARYVLYVMLVSGVLISLQVIIRYLQLGGGAAIKNTFYTKTMDIGWGGPNNYSIVLAMCMPATVFYSIKYGKFSPLLILLATLQGILVFLSHSRGAVLFGGLTIICAMGYAVTKSEYRGRMIATQVIMLMATLIIVMYKGNVVGEAISDMLKNGLDDNGREELWAVATELFKRQPVFGVGFDYNLGGLASDNYTPYWYHSTFYQALASTGAVGLIGWIYLECARLRVFFTSLSSEKIFLLLGFSAFWLYAMTDTLYFTPNGLLFLLIITLAMEKTLTEKQGRPFLMVKLERDFQKNAMRKNESM